MRIDVHIEGVGTDRQALADAMRRAATGPFILEVKGRHSGYGDAARSARAFDTLVRVVR